jgi:hypothetical protein
MKAYVQFCSHLARRFKQKLHRKVVHRFEPDKLVAKVPLFPKQSNQSELTHHNCDPMRPPISQLVTGRVSGICSVLLTILQRFGKRSSYHLQGYLLFGFLFWKHCPASATRCTPPAQNNGFQNPHKNTDPEDGNCDIG